MAKNRLNLSAPSTVGNFKQLNKTVVGIINNLLDNDVFCKLIVGKDSKINLSEIPALTKDEKTKLVYNNIFPVPFLNELEEEGNYVIVTIDSISPSGTDNKKFVNYLISIDVYCHLNLWKTNLGLRPFLLMEQIDGVMNQYQNEGSIGRLEFGGANLTVMSTEMMGYSMKYYNVDIAA